MVDKFCFLLCHQKQNITAQQIYAYSFSRNKLKDRQKAEAVIAAKQIENDKQNLLYFDTKCN